MIRKGNKYIMVIRSSNDLKEIKNNIEKYKDELKDGEQLEVQVAKSGKYILKMVVTKSDTKYEVSTDDKKHVLEIGNKDDAVALHKLIQVLLALAFNKPDKGQ